MRPAQWKPTVRAPSYVLLRRLAKLPRYPLAQTYSKLHKLGGPRFAALVGLRRRAKQLPRLYLVVLHNNNGAWRVDRALLADYQAIARELKLSAKRCSAATRVLVSLYAADYDWDGRPELKVRHRLKGCSDEDPGQATPLTRLQIYNVAPLRAALDTMIRVGSGPDNYDTWETKLDHRKDLDGDGHPDLVIRFHGVNHLNNLLKFEHESVVRTYHWQASTDRYKLVGTKKKAWETRAQH